MQRAVETDYNNKIQYAAGLSSRVADLQGRLPILTCLGNNESDRLSKQEHSFDRPSGPCFIRMVLWLRWIPTAASVSIST